MPGKTKNSPTITKAAAARLCGLSVRYLHELIDVGVIAVDHKNRILRGPFMRWLAAKQGAPIDGQ
jgi:hypothetical protein